MSYFVSKIGHLDPRFLQPNILCNTGSPDVWGRDVGSPDVGGRDVPHPITERAKTLNGDISVQL